MPKLRPNEKEEANRILRACIACNMARYGISDEEVIRRVGICKSSWINKKNRPETFTRQDLLRLSSALKFTPIQAASIILGRDLTAKEAKDFILM